MSEWVSTRLGDVTRQVQELVKVAPGTEYPLLGVKWYAEGPFLREVVTSKTSKATRFYRVQPGQFIYNRLFAWKGSFGLVGHDLAGTFVSNEFPLFDCDRTRLLPEFLNLHFGQQSVWSNVERVSTGTTASRSRWKEAQFNNYRLILPSTGEQRRIIDVMEAIDAQIEALVQELVAVTRVTSSLRDELIGGLSNEPVAALGSVLSIVRGGSPRPIGEYLTDADDGINWIKIGDIRSDGKYVDHTAQKIRPEGRARSREVAPGDFILSNSMSFGRPYMVRIHGCVHDGWLVLRDAEGNFHQEFLYELLRSAQVQAEFERLAAGSGVRNLKRDSVRTVEVPVPDLERQLEIATTLATQHVAFDELTDELTTLRAFRSSLLSSLLTQEIEVPESYEALLEEAP